MNRGDMRIIHVVGKKNHGKTTLIKELVSEFVSRGVRVGAIKFCAHAHELDTPGKDSFLYRHAGATPVLVVTPELTAVYRPRPAGDDPYRSLPVLFGECALILVEGNTAGPGPKLEVWRKERGTVPYAAERSDILALVTDDPIDVSIPVLPRRDIAALASYVAAEARAI